MARIIIDAGHGGTAPLGSSSAFGGRGAAGTLEKDVTLDIARHVVARLGRGAALTRRGDTNLSLGSRAARAARDRADVFVSIHANSGTPDRSGPETYVHPDAGTASHRLAGGIQAALERLGGRYGGSDGSRRGQMAVLSPAALGSRTAACLVEVDYLSNPHGEQRLRDPRQRAAIGAAIADAITSHVARYGQGDPAASADELQTGNRPSVRMPPSPVINQVGRAHGLVELAPRGSDSSLGFGVVGGTGQVHVILHATVPGGGTGAATVRIRGPGGVIVHEQRVELQAGGPHMLPSIYAHVGDGDHVIELINEGNTGVRIDCDLRWVRNAIQGRRMGQGTAARGPRHAVGLDRPTPDPYIIPDPSSYAGSGLGQFLQIWAQWSASYVRWRSGVPHSAYPYFPHSAICELEMTNADGSTGFGTGFYIGPETVLTCAHNIFDPTGSFATSVRVRPGKSPVQSIFPDASFAIPNAQARCHPSWVATRDRDWDMAVIHTPGLPAPNGAAFTLPNMTPAGTEQVVVCGYGKFHGTPAMAQGQYMDGGTILNATEHQYHFAIQGVPGHSGSPVFWNDMVIAIFTGPRMLGTNNTTPASDYENRGVRLTPAKLAWITNFLRP
jgi:N-acetylmuramoyl-L-alanine amidase/V8-like Glu-specific endopeptidase